MNLCTVHVHCKSIKYTTRGCRDGNAKPQVGVVLPHVQEDHMIGVADSAYRIFTHAVEIVQGERAVEEAELKAHIEFMVKEAERKRFAQEVENAKQIADEKQKNWELATYNEMNRCFTRDKERWGQSPWTPKQAIERFKFQIIEF